jgi:hypothetical protein
MSETLESVLKMSPLTKAQRADLWDAYEEAADADALASKLATFQVPKEVKAKLWDLKAAGASQDALQTAQDVLGRNKREKASFGAMALHRTGLGGAIRFAPEIGATVGGIAGMAGGPAGVIAGATLGGMGGEALRQTGQRLTGQAAPATSGEAAAAIAGQGARQGTMQAAGVGLGAGMAKAAPWLLQRALKPTLSVLEEYRTTAPKVVRTLLDEGVSVTQSGLAKLQRLISTTNKEIKEAVANAPGLIPKERVAARVATTAQKVAQQTNPTKDLEAVGSTVEEFLNHPVYKGPLSVPEAQAMKVGTYKQIGKKYGQLSSAEVETQKALARGLREEIEAELPQIAGLNAREAELLVANEAVGRQVALSGNKDPVGFAWVTAHPATFLAALIDRQPVVKSMLANGMWKSAGAAAHVAPALIRAAAIALASSPNSVPESSLDMSPASTSHAGVGLPPETDRDY